MAVTPGFVTLTWTVSGSSANRYSYRVITGKTHTPAAGQYLYYGVRWVSGPTSNLQIAMDLIGGGVSLRDAASTSVVDQAGRKAHPSTDLSAAANGAWYDRKIPLAAVAGTALNFYLVCEGDVTGTYVGDFRNIYVGDIDGNLLYEVYVDDSPTKTIATPTLTPSGPQEVDVTLASTTQTRAVETTVSSGGGGGGGGSKGTGNMLGAFTFGSTMLGADPGSGTGGTDGGSGVGNMLGGFFLGSTMLGADPAGGGGGDAPPINVGAVYPVTAAVAGLANVVGAFATFTYPVSASAAGVAVVQNAYLNSPWALEATTVNATGITKTPRTTTSNILIDIPQGERRRTATIDVTGLGSSFSAIVYARQSNGLGGETIAYSVGGNASSPYRLQNAAGGLIDAGSGNYISRVVLTVAGGITVTWDWLAEPQSFVTALLFSPIALRASVQAGATVTASMDTHTLDGGDCIAGATVEGEAYRVLQLRSGLLLANANVAADLVNIKDLYAQSSGEASLSTELVLRYLSAGDSSVTGDVTQHSLTARNRCAGSATVTANMRRNEGFQGDSLGDSEVTEQISVRILIRGTTAGTSTASADLTYPAPLGSATANGSSDNTASLAIYNLRGSESRGESSVSASLRFSGFLRLMANPAGEASLVADFRVRGRLRAQTIMGEATMVGLTNRLWYLNGTPAGEATGTGQFEIFTIPPGPSKGEATVVGENAGDYKLRARTADIVRGPDGQPVLDADGNEVDEPGRCGAKVIITRISNQTTIPGGTSQGQADVRARMASALQDFAESSSAGVAAVIGQVLISDLSFQAKSLGGGRLENYAVNQNGQPLLDARGQKIISSYNDNIVSAYLPLAAAFAGIARAEGIATFVRAILLLNDSGLIFGDARVEGTLDYASRNYKGTSNGFSKPRGQFDFASDLKAVVTDAYAGVGKWFPGGFFRLTYFDFSLTMAPIPDDPEHAGLPGNATRHGANAALAGIFGEAAALNATVDSYIDGHVWDGTYKEWEWGEMQQLGLDLRNYPELWDQELTTNGNFPVPYKKYPAGLYRKYRLLTLGQAGTWMVDNRGAGFRDKAMRANPVGEARFDEPQSTVDMDLELKSSMRGRIDTGSVVTAAALLLSIRTLTYTGNVTALRTFTRLFAGNLAKSPEALVSMDRTTSDLIAPVNQTNALYV